jgi:hypothetical protein
LKYYKLFGNNKGGIHNSKDFLELSKRNIFHTTVWIKHDAKYTLNYIPWIITEFLETKMDIKDIHTKKLLFTGEYAAMESFKVTVCSRLMAMSMISVKLFDLQYIIHFKDGRILYLGLKNVTMILDILDILRTNS